MCDFFVKIDQRFSYTNRSPVFILKPDPDFQIAIAIMIAIKNRIRIDRDPIFVCKLIPGFYCPTGSLSLKKCSGELPMNGRPNLNHENW